MVERRGGARFLLEPMQALDVVRERRRKQLEGDVSTEPRIVSAVHLAHSPGANEPTNLVPTRRRIPVPLARSLLFPTAVRRSTECAAFITCRWRSSHAACGSPEPHARIAREFPSDHARPGVCGGTPRPGWRRARPGSPLSPVLLTFRD